VLIPYSYTLLSKCVWRNIERIIDFHFGANYSLHFYYTCEYTVVQITYPYFCANKARVKIIDLRGDSIILLLVLTTLQVANSVYIDYKYSVYTIYNNDSRYPVIGTLTSERGLGG